MFLTHRHFTYPILIYNQLIASIIATIIRACHLVFVNATNIFILPFVVARSGSGLAPAVVVCTSLKTLFTCSSALCVESVGAEHCQVCLVVEV